LQHHLFDVAANLLLLGHNKEVQKYLASEEEYAAYYARINGAGSSMITGNVHGSFLFGSAWPERWEYGAKLEAERTLKPWGSFVELYLFKQAYDTVSDHKDRWQLLQDDGTEHNRFRTHDRIRVVNMVRELQSLVSDEAMLSVYRGSSHFADAKIRKLISELKPHVQATHNLLLRAKSKSLDKPNGQLRYDHKLRTLYVKDKEFSFGRARDQADLLRVMFENEKDLSKEWFFDEVSGQIDSGQEGKRYITRYKNAAYQINQKFAKAGMPAFFIARSSSAQITQQYLA
jgi:hypothetical protein